MMKYMYYDSLTGAHTHTHTPQSITKTTLLAVALSKTMSINVDHVNKPTGA